jgi:serine acetyltransferase
MKKLKRSWTTLRCLAADASRVRDAAARRGASHPRMAAAADPSLWALALLRGGTAARQAVGSSLGATIVLRTLFHIDVWTDDIGAGLRLPHPFNLVIGGGVTIGEGCTLMHNVTVQHGRDTHIGAGSVVCNGATVLAGSHIGAGSLIGAQSVVRGAVPSASVAVGAPARVVRAVRPSEVSA